MAGITSQSNIGDEHLTGFSLTYRQKTIGGIIYGLRNSGYFDLCTLSGEKIHSSAKWQNLKLIERARTLILERREQRIPLHLVEGGVSCAGF